MFSSAFLPPSVSRMFQLIASGTDVRFYAIYGCSVFRTHFPSGIFIMTQRNRKTVSNNDRDGMFNVTNSELSICSAIRASVLILSEH